MRNVVALVLLILLVMVLAGWCARADMRQPVPGEAYREYVVVSTFVGQCDTGTGFCTAGRPGTFACTSDDHCKTWRVTDPDSPNTGATPYLPNPEHTFTIDDVADFDDASSAELIISHWSGHIGTTGRQLNLNQFGWTPIPDLTTTPACTDPTCDPGAVDCYFADWNAAIDLPLGWLKTGSNTLEVLSDEQDCYAFGSNWGQWGFWGGIVRVYFDTAKVPEPTGAIDSPAASTTITDDPEIVLSTSDDLDRVEFLAYYDGYDFDGDGDYTDYQQTYRRRKYGTEFETTNHIGTLTEPPWEITWDTTWVPDQAAASIKLVARIRDTTGLWWVTPEIDNLTLSRPNHTVQLFKPENVPEKYIARDTRELQTSNVTIPASVNLNLITEARLLMHTYNGNDAGAGLGEPHSISVNGVEVPTGYGKSFYYDMDWVVIQPNWLQHGVIDIDVYSESTNHGIEMLWPGPGILISSEIENPGGGLVGADIDRSHGGDFAVRITRPPSAFMNTRAKRAAIGAVIDQVNWSGSAGHVLGCSLGETDISKTTWCNSHMPSALFDGPALEQNHRNGRCAGNMREACADGRLFSSPPDRCTDLGLGSCWGGYWPYFVENNREFWGRDPHGHKLPMYYSARNSTSCNYERGMGYCATGPYEGQGCGGPYDCGHLETSGRCGGMCSTDSDDPGVQCSHDSDCTNGTCVDAAPMVDLYPDLTTAGGSCSNFDGSECRSGFCEMRSYHDCGGVQHADPSIPNPGLNLQFNDPATGQPIPMNFEGREASMTFCRWMFNMESDSPILPYMASVVADEVTPWPGEEPEASPIPFTFGNELGGPASAWTEEGGGRLIHFTDNSNALPFADYLHNTRRNPERKCNISRDLCTNNASCPSGEVCSSQQSPAVNYTRSEYDHTQPRSMAEGIVQNLRTYSNRNLAAHTAGGLAGGAIAEITYHYPGTCETWAGYTGKRCKLYGANTEYYCETDLDCERIQWDSAIRIIAGGYYCDRSLRICPNQNECDGQDGDCLYFEPQDTIETEYGGITLGITCYDAQSGAGCPSAEQWHMSARRGYGGSWGPGSTLIDEAIAKLEFWWEVSQATETMGAGAPVRQMHDMVLSNHQKNEAPHGRGIYKAISNRYQFGFQYLYSIAQKNQNMFSPWRQIENAANCEHCFDNNYPAPACSGYKTCDPIALVDDVYPWLTRSLGCATGPGGDTWTKYGVAPSGVYYREFAKGYVACNFGGHAIERPSEASDDSPPLNVEIPAAPEGKWCTSLAGLERVGGNDEDCNSNGDDIVQDYDGGPSGPGFPAGTQTLDARTCIILYDEGSTQPDCDLLPEYSYTSGGGPVIPADTTTSKGTVMLGVKIGAD